MSKAIEFLKQCKEELKKVDWPSRQKTINYTVAVIQLSLAIAFFLGILDLIFSSVIEKFIV